MKQIEIKDISKDEKPGLYELRGSTGCGKTTLALKIGDSFVQNGKVVRVYQRKLEETIIDVLGHMLIEANLINECCKDVAHIKPDLIILDDFANYSEEIRVKLGKFAEINKCKILVTRQSKSREECEMKLYSVDFHTSEVIR